MVFSVPYITMSGDDGPVSSASFAGSRQTISADTMGNMYIAAPYDQFENGVGVVRTSTGIVTTVAGSFLKRVNFYNAS